MNAAMALASATARLPRLGIAWERGQYYAASVRLTIRYGTPGVGIGYRVWWPAADSGPLRASTSAPTQRIDRVRARRRPRWDVAARSRGQDQQHDGHSDRLGLASGHRAQPLL